MIGFAWAWMLVGFFSLSYANEFCGLKCNPPDPVTGLVEQAQSAVAMNPAADCEPAEKNSEILKETPLAGGARKMMAMVYGSCAVLKLKARQKLNPKEPKIRIETMSIPTGTDAARTNHPYLGHFRDPGCTNAAECSDANLNKPVVGIPSACKKIVCDAYRYPSAYRYGGKAKNESEVTSHEFRAPASVQTGVDCSYFVFQSMNQGGLRFEKNKENYYRASSALSVLGQKDKDGNRLDCFDQVVDQEGGIHPGDMIVIPGKHAALVDTVGPDPFGINAMIEDPTQWKGLDWEKTKGTPNGTALTLRGSVEKIDQIRQGTSTMYTDEKVKFLNDLSTYLCSNALHWDRFKLTIIHSSSNGNHTGVQREDNPSGCMRPPLLQLSKAQCIRAMKQKWREQVPEFADAPSAIIQNIARSSTSKILRHASDEPDCRTNPPSVPESACADCCDLNSTYEEMI